MGFLKDIAKGGLGIVGGILGADASGDAAESSSKAAMAGVAENRRQFDTVLNLQSPAINTGNAARSLLASILGLDVAGSTYSPGASTPKAPAPTGLNGVPGMLVELLEKSGRIDRKTTQPVGNAPLTFNNPASSPMSAGDITARLEAYPGYQFAVQQATQAAQGLGSATGSLGGNVVSGLAERVGGGIAMPTFENYLNRLAGLSGGAQTATNSASGAAMNTGALVANGLQNAGDSRAAGILGQTNSIGGILSGIGQVIGNHQKSPYEIYTGNPYGNVPRP